MSSITTIIPTKDEAIHIARATRSALPLGPVWVVDAESADDTATVARVAGAQVVIQAWLGHANQKNWALDHLPIQTEWVLFLDADEYLEPESLVALSAATRSDSIDGYYLARRNFFLGRELRHAWWYPDYQLRLFRRGTARYEEREVHEHMRVDGCVAELDVSIVHENKKGIEAFLERHNRYSSQEAREILNPSPEQLAGSVRGGWAARRRLLKRIWLRMPARPILRFCWLYVVRRGFLDGRPGLLYSALIASYDLMIIAKVEEGRRVSDEDGRLVDR